MDTRCCNVHLYVFLYPTSNENGVSGRNWGFVVKK
jgi:hypothetical protein